jgi:tetratricopeptide (TPR) repeat protein
MRLLRAAGFLVEVNQRSGVVHSFAHALTQSVVYDTLLRSDRRRLHARVLRALEVLHPDDHDEVVNHLAHHALQAEVWPEAARYALVAGQRANRRSALIEARAYLETAIGALSHQPATVDTMTLGIDARLSLRSVLVTMNESSAIHEHLKEAYDLAEQAGDRLNLARVYISRGSMLSHSGDLPSATELSRAALDIMLASNESVGIVSASFSLAQALWYSGDLDTARQVLTANAAHARDESGQRRTTATFVLPSVVYFCYLARISEDLGDSAAGFEAIKEAGAIASRHGHVFDQVLVNTYEGGLLLANGQQARSIEMLERVLDATRSNKIEWHIPLIAAFLGRAYVDAGRHADARLLLRHASTLADRNRHVGKRLLCSPPLVRALAEEDLVAAKGVAMATLRDAEIRGFRPTVVHTQLALAHIHLSEGRPGEAETVLKEAAALAQEIGLLREELEARERLSALFRQGGHTTPAAAEMQAATGLRKRLASFSADR